MRFFEKPYHKIHGILLDTKTVMQNYGKSNAAQNVLANVITTAEKKGW